MSLRVDPGAFSTCATATGIAGAAVTLTIAAVPAKRIAITGIRIMRAANGAEATAAVHSVTTTNLPGSLAWNIGFAVAAGASNLDVDMVFDPPLLSSAANTATTIVCPDPGTTPIWTINCSYYEVAEL